MMKMRKSMRRPLAIVMVLAMVLSLVSGFVGNAPKKALAAGNILTGTDFSDVTASDDSEWTAYVGTDWSGVDAAVTGNGDGSMTIAYSNVGWEFYDAIWGLQITQHGVTFEEGKNYRLRFTVDADGAKGAKVKINGHESVLDYDFSIQPGITDYEIDLNAIDATFTDNFLFAMGWVAGDAAGSTPTITISDLSITEIVPEIPNVLRDTAFTDVTASDDSEWTGYVGTDWSGVAATVTGNSDGTMTVAYSNVGWEFFDAIWGLQITQHNVTIEPGKTYKLTFTVDADAPKGMKVKFDGHESFLDQDISVPAGKTTYTYNIGPDDNGFTSNFLFAMGWVAGDVAGSTPTLVISDLSLTEVGGEAPVEPPVLEDPKDYENARSIEQMDADGWDLVWNDEFDGTALDTTKWSYQIGNGATASNNPGWGNQEMEYYTDKEDNVKVEDGKLVITAKQETTTDPKEGTFNYTSGRIRTVSDTENLFSVKYGRVEAYMSLPIESGCWPAFWMLPDNYDIYGGWAASGEIDIMEGWGNRPYEACGTLHYGSNWPNNLYKGKTFKFDKNETNVNAYHLYALEWEPGKLSWYYDDQLLYSADTWNSIGRNAADDFTFGAPFDVPFYILLNVAVGGTFGAGDPATGDFSGDGNTKMTVDYVRVYQSKDGYDDSDVKPGGSGGDSTAFEQYVQPILDAAGVDSVEGYDFAGDDDFGTLKTVDTVDPDDSDWQFYVGDFGGAATVDKVVNGDTTYAAVDITSAGNQAYAIQLIKHMPFIKGYTYKVSFDAYADAARNITIHPSGDADNGWAGYASETKSISTEPQTYSFTFTMGNDSDPTARLEFNLGAAGTANVCIGNVNVEIVSADAEEEEVKKSALGDGNLIWNGTFDEGAGRLQFWNYNNNTLISVPSYVLYELGNGDQFAMDKNVKQNYARRAAISVSGGEGTLSQGGITLAQSDQYSLKFDVHTYSDEAVPVKITVSNANGSTVYSEETIECSAEGTVKTFESIFAMPKGVTDNDALVTFTFADGTSILLDNVKLLALTKNNASIDYSSVNTEPIPSDSSDWYINYHTAANDPAVADADGVYSVDTWKDTNNYQSMFLHEVDIVEGVTYTFTFDAKSDVDNTYIVGIQEDNSWAMAWDTVNFSTTPDWNTYTYTFTSKLTTGGNPMFMKFLLSDCENTAKLYFRNLSLKANVESGAGDPEDGSAVLKEDPTAGNDVVIKLADNDWAAAFVDAALSGGKAVIMINELPLDAAELKDMVSEDGIITLPGAYFAEAGTYKIELALEGYNNYVLNANIEEPETEEPETEEPVTEEPTEASSEEASSAADSGTVDTGDTANTALWLVLMAMAAVILGAAFTYRRRVN